MGARRSNSARPWRAIGLAVGVGCGLLALVLLAAKLDVPRLDVDVMLDDVLDAAAIDSRLQRLEQLACQRSVAVGLGQPLPLTFARIQAWAEKSTAAGIVLAPATAIVDRQ
ncbi:divergent polysaccharide deacetylase family protein [Defluviicoccus vanus]|uniref:Divergent polysaccharide deacetylase family protein n=1 Tax=Defluviicoccus vanus TaxID=111831 RepID=A0A7H1N3F0_9PROT|nr:divergent polysaccharide deacetylase family protein [Defluviicoccus vanus]QNT70236.1 divergent polysaccharide deacetylase family protein [Defluviicoccus vanus]